MTPILVVPTLDLLTAMPGLDAVALIASHIGANTFSASSDEMSLLGHLLRLVVSVIEAIFL